MYQERTGAAGTTICSVGDPVGSIESSVGGYWAIAPSDAARPILRQSGAGRKYLEFSGVTQALQVPNFALTSRMYVGAAAQNAVSGSGMWFLEQSAQAALNDGFLVRGTSTFAWLVRRTLSHSAVGSGNWSGISLSALEWLYTTATQAYYLDGVAQASGTIAGTLVSDTTATDTLNIGSRNGASQFFNGSLYALVIADSADTLSAGDLANLRTWVGQKAGRTL